MKSKDLAKTLVFTGSFAILFLSLYLSFFNSHPITLARRYIYSLSAGDQYYGYLSLWYLFAQKGDWVTADKLESRLDPAHISPYKQENYPPFLKKRYNQLVVKTDKTIQDILELARIQVRLGNQDDARQLLYQAQQIDPIRDDIKKMYLELVNLEAK